MWLCGFGEGIGTGLGADVCDDADDDDAMDETQWRHRFWRLDALEGADNGEERHTNEADLDSTDGGDESDTEEDDLAGISDVAPHGVYCVASTQFVYAFHDTAL